MVDIGAARREVRFAGTSFRSANAKILARHVHTVESTSPQASFNFSASSCLLQVKVARHTSSVTINFTILTPLISISRTTMDIPPETVLANIHQYAAKARDSQERSMDLDVAGTEDRLMNTIRELQEQVDKQRAALETVSYFECNNRIDLLLIYLATCLESC